MSPEARHAVELGRAQLDRLRRGDFEAYEVALAGYEAACDALSTLDPAAFGPDDDDLLRDLIVIERDAALELARLRRETSVRMSTIRRGGRVAGAYLATPAPIAGHVNHA
jgi:hypothetical protein